MHGTKTTTDPRPLSIRHLDLCYGIDIHHNAICSRLHSTEQAQKLSVVGHVEKEAKQAYRKCLEQTQADNRKVRTECWVYMLYLAILVLNTLIDLLCTRGTNYWNMFRLACPQAIFSAHAAFPNKEESLWKC